MLMDILDSWKFVENIQRRHLMNINVQELVKDETMLFIIEWWLEV
jgi:hypothetical protein